MRNYFLKYTDNIKSGFGGCAFGPFIKIRPKYANDKGLLLHEIEHVNQWWRCLFICLIASALFGVIGIGILSSLSLALAPSLHGVLYRFSRKYRLRSEVSAYRKQLSYYGPATSNRFAIEALVNKYDLKITYHMAKALLNYRK